MDEKTWVAEAAGKAEEQEFDSDGRIAFEDGPFSGSIERMQIRPGIALYRVEGASSHAWRLRAIGESPAGNLVLGTMLEGAGTIDAKGNERQLWRGPGRPFLLSLAEREIAYHLEAGEQWTAVTLLLEPEAMENLASQNELPPLARTVLKDGRLPVSQVFDLNPTVVRSAHEILRSPYRGSMEALWRESKALELLAHHLDHLSESGTPQSALGLRDLARVREAYKQLVEDLRTPPSLATLAAQAKLSPRRLNQGFRYLYGMTVFDALLEARMKAACDLVRERQDVPLKHIAWMVGYNQLSNFINAYRRRFGVPPGQHRRSIDSE